MLKLQDRLSTGLSFACRGNPGIIAKPTSREQAAKNASLARKPEAGIVAVFLDCDAECGAGPPAKPPKTPSAVLAFEIDRENYTAAIAGGQPPRERYSSAPLFNSIMLGEVQDIYEVEQLDQALSGVPLDRVITSAANPQDAPWTLGISEQHYWQTLKALDRQISGDVRKDVIATMRKLRDATGRYTVLESAGVTFERYTGKDHLNDWLRALREFQTMAGLSDS